jgi:hypothetical protein
VNGALHFGQTRRWAIEAGFDEPEADEIARADIGVDRLYPGRIPANWPWHYRIAGANRRAARLLREAVIGRDLALLGMALHCRQDALTHNLLGPLGHWPGIDDWEGRGERVRDRIECASRDMLGAYRHEVDRPE